MKAPDTDFAGYPANLKAGYRISGGAGYRISFKMFCSTSKYCIFLNRLVRKQKKTDESKKNLFLITLRKNCLKTVLIIVVKSSN
jgi:hypothetical protein